MATTKRLCCDERTNDRISELPRNVMDNIFDRMSIRDAARTSILSTKWRYIWASYPKLVFDENFFKKISRKHGPQFIRYEFSKVINEALLVHIGPILKFMLYIPNISNDLSSGIDKWVLFLSRNGIKEVMLKNSNPTPYILPSCISSCTSLRYLKVNNCKSPHAFGVFHYLVKLSLERVSFPTDVSAPQQYNFPVLEWLTILHCTGIEQRRICAPMLNYLTMVESGKVDWEWIMSNKQLTTLQIGLSNEVKNVEHTINMMKFLGNIPKVWKLWLNGFALKYLGICNPHKVFEQQHPYLINSLPLAALLTHITLHFEVDDHDQISSTLCLFKNCPNLRNLEVHFAISTDDDVELVREYMEPSNCMDVSLDMLQMVKIRYMNGLKAELLFIKLILARSTRLQRMVIEQSYTVGASNGYTISRELLRFPRASSSAEIIYLDALAPK